MDIEKLRELQAHFERTRSQTPSALETYRKAEEITKQFQEKFSLEGLTSLGLEDYILGTQNTDSFCHWLIYQTDEVGRIFVPGAALAFGVYYNRENNAYAILEQGKPTFVKKPVALDRFERIKNGLVSILLKFAKEKDFEKIALISKETLDPLILGKVLSLYYPTEYIAIFSNRHVNDFLKVLGIDVGKANLFQKREALLKFKKSDEVMSKWSNRKFVDFLYWEFYRYKNGYIVNTHPKWFENFVLTKKTKDGFVFWGKRDDLPTTKIGVGTTLFFRIVETDPPVIRGFAQIVQTDVLPLNEAWSRYGALLGYESIDSIIETSNTFTSEKKLTPDNPIFCIVLETLRETTPINTVTDLPPLGLSFDYKHIVTGKVINDNQTDKLLKFIKPSIYSEGALKKNSASVLEIIRAGALESLSAETSISVDKLTEWISLLKERKQIIFYGPPGTGKTFVAEKFADYFMEVDGYRELVTFHPSYSYEDFIEGIRPKTSPDEKSVVYQIMPGVFKIIAERARRNPTKKFVLLIDEINRGNIAKIFGELIHCLEYRGPDHKVRLLYSGADTEKESTGFYMPDNLYIIGTMNSADRSIALVDYALRRRFCFIDFMPNMEILAKWLNADVNKAAVDKTKVTSFLKTINEAISNDGKLGKHYQIGHSYLMRKELDQKKLDNIWIYDILPLLEEYYFEDIPAIQKLEKFFKDTFHPLIAPTLTPQTIPVTVSNTAGANQNGIPSTTPQE